MIERNWKKYNENLVKRGEIWISKEILQKEENKRGRPYATAVKVEEYIDPDEHPEQKKR